MLQQHDEYGYLLDIHGRFFAYSNKKLCLKNIEDIDAQSKVLFSPAKRLFLHKGKHYTLNEYNKCYTLIEGFSSNLVAHQEDDFIKIFLTGMILHTNNIGLFSLNENQDDCSKFFLIPQNTFDLLLSLKKHGLNYIDSHEKHDIFIRNFCIKDGIMSFPLALNTDVSLKDKHLALMSEKLTLHAISIFNPAVYFCAFSSYKIFNSALLSVLSYYEKSDVNFTYIIFTNIPNAEIPDQLKDVPIKIIHTASIGLMSHIYKRYDEEILQHLTEYSPIIYSDSDILCNNTLKEMLARCHNDDGKFYISRERRTDRHDVLHGGWHISSFLEDDPSIKEQDVLDVNSGFFIFKNVESFLPASRLIKRIALQIYQKHSSNHYSFDQSVLNYILIKFVDFDADLLQKYMTFYSCVFRNPPEDFVATPKLGIIHFFQADAVGEFKEKIHIMNAYYDAIEGKRLEMSLPPTLPSS